MILSFSILNIYFITYFMTANPTGQVQNSHELVLVSRFTSNHLNHSFIINYAIVLESSLSLRIYCDATFSILLNYLKSDRNDVREAATEAALSVPTIRKND